MAGSGVNMVKAGTWEVPKDFRCRKPEFAEYLGVAAVYDQQQKMGRMYWAVRGSKIAGYMMLAMGHVGKERQTDLGIDTYGPIPALVISRLAADERHERNGVGRHMVSYAVSLADKMALEAGCRLVLADSDRDAVGFYEKMRFVKFAEKQASGHDRPPHEPARRADTGADDWDGLVLMYLDMNPSEP